MPKADATGLAPEKSAEQNPPAPFIGRRRVLSLARPISMVKSQSGGLGHSNATTARRAFQIEFFTALPAKLDGKQSENLGGKDRDPLHDSVLMQLLMSGVASYRHFWHVARHRFPRWRRVLSLNAPWRAPSVAEIPKYSSWPPLDQSGRSRNRHELGVRSRPLECAPDLPSFALR
jgi:hypothetical protein